MKRFSMFSITVALIVGLVGCAPAPTPTRYNLTMAVAPAGSGNATDLTNASPYAAGTVVNITAVAAVGYQFVNWTALVGTFANANAAQTTFTMPAHYATVTANFALKAAEIRTWYDLDAIRDNPSGDYLLMNDLDSTTAGYEELAAATANGGKGWEPIGSLFADPFSFYIVDPVDPFTGSLDGQGYEIWDLFIDRPDEDGVGFFGCVDGGGVVENLGMVNVAVAGRSYVGSLVGENHYGTVSNSYSTGSVTGHGLVGGLVGENHDGTVSNSYSTGSVTGDAIVGGLVGENHDGTVSNSYYIYGEVLINGRNIITIGALSNEDFEQWLANDKFLDVNERLSQEDGYYLINDVNDFKSLLAFGQDGALKFRLTSDLNLGSEPNFYIPYLAGEFDGNGRKIANLSFSFDFTSQVGLFGYLASGGAVTGVSAENVNITGHVIVGGLVGENDGGTVSNSYSTGRVAGYWSVGGMVGRIGWNGGTVSNSYYNYDEVLINGKNIITIGALFNEDFDQWLANDKFLDVNERLAQEDGYYLIDDVSDFKQLLAFGQDGSLKFRLTNDLDLGGDPNFYIPYLAGEFDGNGHKIWNLSLYFDFVAHVGLFGYLASGGKVSEVGVENVNVTGAQEVGGLVGGNSGIVSNSCSSGSVTGGNDAGGLVGWNEGTVSNSYSSGSVTGGNDVGGLVGWNYWGTVNNSYSSGIVTGVDHVGGLVGERHEGTVSNSFWDRETSGMEVSYGGTGKTTAEMRDIAAFSGVGWNIIAVDSLGERNLAYIWNIVDGLTYPFLSWQSVS